MLQKKFYSLLLLCLFAWSISFSQNIFENYQFISLKEGVSKRAISTIIQDQHGFMWIGTNGAGLYKFDGVDYISYEYDRNNPNAINSNLIYTTFVDTYKKLWVGTDEGLAFYNRDLDRFENFSINKKILKRNQNTISVKSIIQDNFGNLIIGTLGDGIFKINLKTLQVASIKSNINYQINCFVKNKNGNIYFGTNVGLKELNSNNEIRDFNPIQSSNLNQFAVSIESLVIDDLGDLWVGTSSNGLLKATINQQKINCYSFPITKKRILSMIDANRNNILCATENDGVFLINKKGEIIQKYVHSKFDNHSLKSNSVWSLYLDKDKRIWLGYYNKGLSIFDKLYNKFNALESLLNNKESLQTSAVTGVVKDKAGKLWISMEGGGIDIFNPATKKFIHVNSQDKSAYSGINNDDIQTVFIDSKQNIWIGSWNGGIYFLKKGSKNFINYNTYNTPAITSNRIMSFSEDSKGNVWIGSFLQGLFYYNPIQNQFYHCNSKPFSDFLLNTANIRKVLVDSDDLIWIGTIDGLYQINFDSNSNFKITSMKNLMSQNIKNHKSTHTILSLYESKDGILWIGTDGAGLFSYNKKIKKFASYNDIEGFGEKCVASIIESNDGSIWIGGKIGMTKFNVANKTAKNFSTDNGLIVNDFNNNAVFKDTEGVLYFGTYEGLNYFNPKQLTKDNNELSLYFTDFKLFNKSINPNDENSPLTKVIAETKDIKLNHNQSVFTIDFIGVNYAPPGKNEYAFYLEGFENKWNYVGNKKSATYTNLEPGNYIFKVKSAVKGGTWNKMPLELNIEILPPWWKTAFAYFSYLIMFVTFIVYVNRFQKKRFTEKEAIIYEREKAVEIEKLNNKKLQFFTNISHEFRTPLTLIINPLEDIIKNKTSELPSDVVHKLQIIHKSSDRLSRLINELMDFRKLQFNKVTLQVQQIEVVDFIKNIVGYFEEEASYRNINLTFESTQEKMFDWLDPKMFEKIVFNILSNAFKFSPDSGSIKVKIHAESSLDYLPLADFDKEIESFKISIEDKGAGLEKKEVKKIFERFYQVNNLNKAYYGSTGIGLEVVKGFVELHKGTKFIITFPLGKHFYADNQVASKDNQNNNIVNKEKKQFLADTKAVKTEDNLPKTKIIYNKAPKERTYTILIVEDNAELRNYLKDELKNDYIVIVAENGKKGFELAMQKMPDLILTDVIMPIMNGIELCKKIKADIKTSHIPLLMLSAKALVQDRIEGIDSGADIYLSKPFDMDVLKSSLSQLITSRQIIFNKFYNGITDKSKDRTTTIDNEFIQRALNFINENISESDLSVEVLADKVFLSRSQLYRKIKTLTGVSVNEFIRNVRLERAQQLIELGNNNINEISYKVGFASPSYFTKCYKSKYGKLPTQSKLN
jgi:signal transduction histidine kinase/ligand-binding sensor domain-containing protein/DNA-binding response OmpR family regulator